MKKFLVLALLFSACGSNESKTETKIADDSTTNTVVTPVADPVIGTPKKLGKIEVAGSSFPGPMIWDQAKLSCEGLGQGWRLPTMEELNSMFTAKDSLGAYTPDLYWSSEEVDTLNAKAMNFSNGKPARFSKIYEAKAWAVRSL